MPYVESHHCTLATCDIKYATVRYDPSLAGNAFFMAFFGLIFLIQGFQAWRYKTWTYSFAMMSGAVIEVVGYLGRVQMHYNPFLPNPFLINIICITIAPVFFAAAIYVTLSRIMVHYGIEHARISPKFVSIGFMTSDFLALVLQAAGGAIADTAPTKKGSDQGTHIMVGGLAFQAFIMLVFMAMAAEYALKVRKARRARVGGYEKSTTALNGRSERSFKLFLLGIALATVCILTRSIFRVAELSKGFISKLANEEVPFMVLEGAMISLATIALTAFHPGQAFGANWRESGWGWKKGGDLNRRGGQPSAEDIMLE